MKVRFSPSLARGTVAAPPSKTLAHRELMAAALSEKPSTVSGVLFSEDVLATLDCARSLGAEVLTEGDRVRIVPGAGVPSSLFPCRESGSTLRFFLPQALRRGRWTSMRSCAGKTATSSAGTRTGFMCGGLFPRASSGFGGIYPASLSRDCSSRSLTSRGKAFWS